MGELQNFPPINLESLTEREANIPANIKKSIELYNKAIESIKNKSEDIAIIELKKAISLNPDFNEAVNLLGLCYGYLNDKQKAAEMFERVIESESNSVKALKYLEELYKEDEPAMVSSKTKKKAGAAKKAAKTEMWPGDASSKEETKTRKNIGFKQKHYLFRYLIGFAAGALIVFLAYQGPPRLESDKTLAPDVTVDGEKEQLRSELSSYIEKYDKLNDDYNKLKEEADAANASVAYYKSAIKLYEIESLVLKKDYASAADMLILLKSTDFKGRDKEKFNELYGKAMPLAAQAACDEGVALAKQERFKDALERLEKVELYYKDFQRKDVVFYYMGKCYQYLNQIQNASAMYRKIIEQYPQSSYAYWAGVRLKEIGGTQ